MKGVTMPGVSAGSNQVGARVTWMPQVSWPCGPPARPDCGAAIARTAATARDAASVPIPRFAHPCGTLDANLGIKGTLEKLMILVPLLNPKFANTRAAI